MASPNASALKSIRVVRDYVSRLPQFSRPLFPRFPSEESENVRDKYWKDISPHLPLLGELRARYLPEAQVPLPCGRYFQIDGSFDPWQNVFNCREMCSQCRGEAIRALDLLEAVLKTGSLPERFLPAEIAAERRRESTIRVSALRRERERASDRFDRESKGYLERMEKQWDKDRSRQSGPHAEGKPASMEEASQWLIALHNFRTYLRGCLGVPSVDLKEGAPDPVVPSRGGFWPLYRLGDLIEHLHRKAPASQRVSLPLNPALRKYLKPPHELKRV